MLCKILAGPVTGIDGINHNTGDTVELSESDAQQLATWGVVEPTNDEPSAPTTAPVPVPSTPVIPATSTEAVSVKELEVPKVPEPAATDSGSTTEAKTKTSTK